MPRRTTTTIAKTVASTQQTKKKTRRTNGEGSVRERPDGRFEMRISLPDGRKSIYGETRKEVLAKARALQQQVEQGMYVAPSRETVADHLRPWLQVKRLKWEDGTYLNKKAHVEKHIIPALGGLRLQQLTKGQIQAFCLDLQGGKQLTAGTIHDIYRTLRAALEDAVEDQKLAVNPAQRIALPKEEKKEPRYLTAEEIEQMIATADDHHLGCLFLLAVAAGMRLGELLALKWEDVDLAQGFIQVRRSLSYRNVDGSGYTYKEKTPKSASSRRRISLPIFAIEALQQHRERQQEARVSVKEWHDLGLVFPNRHGLHRAPTGIEWAYKCFLQKAGVAKANFHATRHGHATNLLEMGENPRTVQERLGHSNIAITLGIYGHVTPRMQQQAVEKLDARFGKKRRKVDGN